MIHKYAEIFCWKNVSSFCIANATHIFSAKNIRILCIESAKTANEMTFNELVKLTMLWTTGPCKLFFIKLTEHSIYHCNVCNVMMQHCCHIFWVCTTVQWSHTIFHYAGFKYSVLCAHLFTSNWQLPSWNSLSVSKPIYMTFVLLFLCWGFYGPVHPMGSCPVQSVYLTAL